MATEPCCPKCGGRVWDNRQSKKNPKAPDFKCRDRSCDGVIWPPRTGNGQQMTAPDAYETPEYLDEQEAHEVKQVEQIKTQGSDADTLLKLEQRMSYCAVVAERMAAKHENVFTDPQALAVTFFIELNKRR